MIRPTSPTALSALRAPVARPFLAPALLGALVVLLAAGAASGQEGGIETFAGETLFDQGARASASVIYKREASVYRGDRRVHDPQDREFEELRVVLGADYGVLPELTVSVLAPIVARSLRRRTGQGREHLRGFGPGDMAALAKVRIYKTDWHRSSFNLAAIVGLELPTGRTDEELRGERLPSKVQPGAGAWNPFVAVGATLDIDRVRFDGLCFYKRNNEGTQDFKAGDFLSLEVDAAYRFLVTDYPGPTASAKLGLQWRHTDGARRRGRRLPDSGSDLLVLRTGVGVHPIPRMDLSLSADVPLYRHVEGEQLVRDVRVALSFGVRF
jgi:hypothetical protein